MRTDETRLSVRKTMKVIAWIVGAGLLLGLLWILFSEDCENLPGLARSRVTVRVGDRFLERSEDPFSQRCVERTILDIKNGFAKYRYQRWDSGFGFSPTDMSSRITGFEREWNGKKVLIPEDRCP